MQNNKNNYDFLKNSMIYQMSLGSKELFHSNIWCWLIENEHSFIKAFIPEFDITKYDYIKAEREKGKRDILIWLEDINGCKQHIVIENKTKALPSQKQLEDYTENIEEHSFMMGILTGIGDKCAINLEELKGIKNTNGYWKYVSYKDISARIYDILKKSQENIIKEHFQQIEEYCKILDNINSILDENIKKHKNNLIYDYDNELNDLRISDIFKKQKGSHFMNYVEVHKNELVDMKEYGFNLVFGQSFHNGKTTLDIRYSNWKDEKTKHFLIGVQIEGDQFRIIAECNKALERISADDFYASLKNNWFDDSYDCKSNRLVFGNYTTMKPREGKKYNKYLTSDYCFIYQYFDIDKIDNSYESLFSLIKDYIKKASQVILERIKG